MRIGFDQKVKFESASSKFDSNLNPCFSYNPGFELSQLPNLILNICIFRKIVIDFNLECLFHMIGEE